MRSPEVRPARHRYYFDVDPRARGAICVVFALLLAAVSWNVGRIASGHDDSSSHAEGVPRAGGAPRAKGEATPMLPPSEEEAGARGGSWVHYATLALIAAMVVVLCTLAVTICFAMGGDTCSDGG